jgi:hypothetical protein
MKLSIISLAILLFVGAARADDLSSVRYRKEGSGHYLLATDRNLVFGDREVAFHLYLLADRYVATYTESKRLDATRSEVLAERELAGSASGASLANLGTLRLIAQTHNGKPVVELTLGQDTGVAPRGTVVRLVWVYSSWAPKSVTGS